MLAVTSRPPVAAPEVSTDEPSSDLRRQRLSQTRDSNPRGTMYEIARPPWPSAVGSSWPVRESNPAPRFRTPGSVPSDRPTMGTTKCLVPAARFELATFRV